MLTELRIADLGVIDDAVLEFGPGFTVVTGETGAGKTMVVSGLGLLVGGRADSGLVRHGTARALVEGRLRADPDLSAAVEAAGGELDDDEVLLTRILTTSRSRARVGGVQVPLPVLTEVVGENITIHGQSDQVRLGSSERQRAVLDTFAGSAHRERVEQYRARWGHRRTLGVELAALREASQARERELAVLRFGRDEIARAEPQPGEDIALQAEARRLQASDDLRRAARDAVVALAGDDEATGDEPNALGLLTAARRAASAVDADDDLAALARRIEEIVYLVGDVTGDLASYLASLDADPARLEWIAARLAELQQLTRRYGTTVDEVLAWRDQADLDVERLTGSDERISELEAAIVADDAELVALATSLTATRREAAQELSRRVEAELSALAMPHATLVVEITPLPEPGPVGADQIAFLFSANPGSAPGPLAKVASGGELSRVRLALEVVLASDSAGHTFVFDEVDAGVGGAVALEIGRRLARLARHAQVIVVTHLAQVAAFADRHYVVQKSDDGQVTTSGVVEAQGTDRVEELARMMAGLEGTRAAHDHARELLDEASRSAG